MSADLANRRCPSVARGLRLPRPAAGPPAEGGAAAPACHRIEALDGLRGLAVLLVLWAHVPALDAVGPVRLLGNVLQPGHLGVDIFFVLSGFLITRILLHGRHHGAPILDFYMRRAARILPIYYLVVGLACLCAAGPYVGWCAAYLSNLYFAFSSEPAPLRHTWSLCVEAHFYLLWPLVLYGLPPGRHAQAAGAVVAVGFVSTGLLALACPSELGGRLIYRFTLTRMASLGVGALFAVHEARLADGPWRRRWLRALGGGAAALLATAFAVHSLGRGAGEAAQAMRVAVQTAAFTLASGAVFLIVVGAHLRGGRAAAALSRGWLPWVGSVSYGVYLYHYPTFAALGVLDNTAGRSGLGVGIAAALCAAAATFAAADLSYRLVERPIRAWAAAGAAPLFGRLARHGERRVPGVAASR